MSVVRAKGPGAGPQARPSVDPEWHVPQAVFLYRDPSSSTLRSAEVAAYLREVLGLPVRVREDFFTEHGKGALEALARAAAATKVRHLDRSFEAVEPLYGEVQFEMRLLRDPAKRVPGVLYDAYRFVALLRDLLPGDERSLRTLHIVFTHRLLGTYQEDGRYHARAVICSVPSVVSTSGLVEAPAKPEAYYKVKAQLTMALGTVPFEAAKEPFAGQFIDYDDPRLTEVAKGYALQAAMYQIAKEAFCEDPACRLFDAHWQSELLAAQIESGRLCARHTEIAGRIRAVGRRKG